jgi:23S rRNA (guanine1835-N2)-methyltransferase
MGTMERMQVPQGEFELARFPADEKDPLRAWNAADEYLLAEVAERAPGGVTVLVNDSWGALAVALAGSGPHAISDSYLSQRATQANLARNGVSVESVRLLSSLDPPPGRIDLLLVRVPKSLALLADQLDRLASSLHADSVVIGAGMVKEIHTSTLEMFERVLGPTRTSFAVKKARLIFCSPDPALSRPINPWPQMYQLPEGLPAVSGLPVIQHAGVFSAERIDLGTRLLLAHLPVHSWHERVVDLACGDGVLGIAAALTNSDAELRFVDESYRAVESSRLNFAALVGAGRAAEFTVADGLSDCATASVDLVLNNPPFHAHHARTDETAWRMFRDARRTLRPGGELWAVGNRHLGYHAKLKRLFGNCETVASNAKFVVFRSVRQAH